MGHYPSDCKATKADVREEYKEVEDEEENSMSGSRTSGMSFTFKTSTMEMRAEDKKYSKDLRRENNDLRRKNHVKDKNLMIASLDNSTTSQCNVRQEVGCDCLPRTATPGMPTELPFEPVEENVPRLEQWIKDYWAGSAFNTCPHQPL